jgi:hypothetical protein
VDGHLSWRLETVRQPVRPGRRSDEWSGVGLGDKERARVIAVDLGSGQTGLIVVDSAGPTRFDQLATDAMPIIESFTFK